jgi:hypothetical protein
MKKVILIVVLGLLLGGNAYAGWFSDPLEKCMDRLIKGSYRGDEQYSAAAAKMCLGN